MSQLVGTLCIGKNIPSLLMWRCHSEATAWRATTSPPWNRSFALFFIPPCCYSRVFGSTTVILGLSRALFWSAALLKRSQEILLNIAFQLLCHKCRSCGKRPSGPLLTNQLLSHELSSLLTQVSNPMLLELKHSLASVCILKGWERLPFSNFKYFLLSRRDFLEATKHRNSSKQRKRVLKVRRKVFALQWNVMEPENW